MPEKRKRDEPKQKRKPKPKLKQEKLRHFPADSNLLPCPLCGKTDFEWGSIHHASYSTNFDLWTQPEKLEARLCLNCGNIQTLIRSNK